MPLHILYLSSPGGGLETNVRVLAPALRAAGHAVSILYLDDGVQELVQLGADEIIEYRAPRGGWHYYFHRATFGLTSFPLVVRTIEMARALARAVTAIHARKPLDLIEIPEVTLPFVKLPVPYLVRLHSAAWTWRQLLGEKQPRADALEIRMERATLQKANAVSAPSRMLADFVRAECGMESLPIEIIPYPVDTNRFCPVAQRANTKRVLFVGRVEARKGADVLLRAVPRVLAQHPDAEFIFAGHVNEELRNLVDAAPPQVKFLGVVPHGELPALYQRATVVVVPSLWDNSPNVIYEAMACGVPVVASRVGGIPELVENGATGLLVPPRDVPATTEAILDLLSNRARCAEMGRRGNEKAIACYKVETILDQTMAVYQHLVAQ